MEKVYKIIIREFKPKEYTEDYEHIFDNPFKENYNYNREEIMDILQKVAECNAMGIEQTYAYAYAMKLFKHIDFSHITILYIYPTKESYDYGAPYIKWINTPMKKKKQMLNNITEDNELQKLINGLGCWFLDIVYPEDSDDLDREIIFLEKYKDNFINLVTYIGKDLKLLGKLSFSIHKAYQTILSRELPWIYRRREHRKEYSWFSKRRTKKNWKLANAKYEKIFKTYQEIGVIYSGFFEEKLKLIRGEKKL